MKLLLGFSEAVQTIRHNKMRSFLTMLGLNIGVAAIIAVISIGLMAREMIMDNVGNLTASLGWIQGTETGRDKGIYLLSPNDPDLLEEFVPGITAIPYLTEWESISARGYSQDGRVLGTEPEYYDIWGLNIANGRFLNNNDISLHSKVVVLGSRAATTYFGELDPIGKTIRAGNSVYTIVGVLDQRDGMLLNDGIDDNSIYVPITTLLDSNYWAWYGKPYLDFVLYKMDNPLKTDEITILVQQFLNAQYGIRSGEQLFEVQNFKDDMEVFTKVFKIITTVISLIAAISLLVSGIGITNIMLVSITERTKEIGIRKALGAKNKDILEQFLIEALFLCFMGGGIGVILGSAISAVTAAALNWSFILPLFAVVIGVSVSIGIGLFFGIAPAMSAARLEPVAALSKE